MDVEKTPGFLLQSQANVETAHIKLATTVLTLGEHMTALAKDEIETRRFLREFSETQAAISARVEKQLQEQREANAQTRDNLNALIRVIADRVRRNGGTKH